MPSTNAPAAVPNQPNESGLRYVVESLVSLAIAVLLVRAFAVEGYIISTGSMAPYLLGFHKQAVCPSCQFPFAVGVPLEADAETNGPVGCPNCGQRKINLTQVPRNEGDQLLVQKFAYLLRQPKRWEVVVFQNPHKPTQAYVKRVIGLPGETLQIKAGDIWIDGQLARKGLDEQRSVRVPICSQAHRPAGDQDERWQVDRGWRELANGFETRVEPKPTDDILDEGDAEHDDASSTSPMAWVRYIGRPVSAPAPSVSGNQFLLASAKVAAPTVHRWPTDEYAYNSLNGTGTRYVVRDLMLSMQLELQSGRGEFIWSMTDGRRPIEVRLSADSQELRLFLDGRSTPAQTAKLQSDLWRKPWLVEISTFDRQLLFAWNGELVFLQNLDDPANDRPGGGGQGRDLPLSVRFGQRDLHASVRDVMLYRDVYYTRGDERHGVKEPYQLGSNEFFFLGDNSPVSLDSRSWADAIVSGEMLIGKPFLVHLPSRPGRIRLGGTEWHVRVPDYERMRYIR